jgi:hypothetical protein
MADPYRSQDTIRKPLPNAVHLKVFLGARFEGSRVNRLIQEEDHLLWPFREHCEVGFTEINDRHPGIRGDWQGEFIVTKLCLLLEYNLSKQDFEQFVDD